MANYGPTELQCEATIIEAARRFGWLVHGERPARAADGSYSTPIKGDPGGSGAAAAGAAPAAGGVAGCCAAAFNVMTPKKAPASNRLRGADE